MEYMSREPGRESNRRIIRSDLVIAGGGLAGTCAAITAAREGLDVVLVQDRPILGGNSSSEVRLWALGATSHMGNNNRWAREGGVVDEIMTENLWRNPEGNPVVFDSILLDMAWAELKLTLLLDTVVHKVQLSNDRIDALEAYCSPESITYRLEAPRFCDATGDGVIAHLSGASYRMGAEAAGDFGEALAPDSDYGELLGSTIYFYSKDTGKPVRYVAPDFALKDVTCIPRYERIKPTEHGCSFWWLEYGGRLDTIADAAAIKRELWKVVYGIWNHIKNSGRFPEAENLTLEWVGSIPGKRESRRFEGDYMLTQGDIVEQHSHEDAVSFGGWAIDLHPADGVYSDKPSCNQYHSRGVYQIPFKSLYSRDVPNLFLAGRLISVSHVALGSTRVMMTGAHNGQAVAMAALLCHEKGLDPRDLSSGPNLLHLQKKLLRSGQFIPHLELDDSEDLAIDAEVEVSNTLVIDDLAASGLFHEVTVPEGMLLPFPVGRVPLINVRIKTEKAVHAVFQLRRSDFYGNFSPDIVIEEISFDVARGFSGSLPVTFVTVLDRPEYLTVVLQPSDGLFVSESLNSLPGILRLRHSANEKVARSAVQEPPPESGLHRLEFWLPERRPNATLWSLFFQSPFEPYSAEFLTRGYERPFIEANSWVSGTAGENVPEIRLSWKNIRTINRLIIAMDGDFDHPMESVQYGHPDRQSPYLPKTISVLDDRGLEIAAAVDVHGSRWDIRFSDPIRTASLLIRFTESRGEVIGIYRVRVF